MPKSTVAQPPGHPFALGWDPELEQRATEQLAAEGRPVLRAAFEDDRPLPEGFSLSRFRHWPFDQGPVGTCWANGTTQAFQIHTAADASAGGPWDVVALSRAMTCFQGKVLDGGGNPADGGSVKNGLRAMGEAPAGVGCCREEVLPYKADRRYLAQRPPAAAFDQAGMNRLVQIADVEIGEPWKRGIYNGHPVAIGIWWPYAWDTSVGRDGRATGIGRGSYGHALAVIGWLENWDGYLWWQIENSHGPIYSPIPPDIQARVIGYKSALEGKTFDFWVRDDWLKTVQGKGWPESVTAAGLTGFKKRILDWSEIF